MCSQLQAAVQETVISADMQAGWLLADLKTALDEFQYPERATVVFTDIGTLGLELTGGQVTRVLGQAQRLGVHVGDKFLSIAGQVPCATTDKIADQLQMMARPGTIVFRRKPMPGSEDAAVFQERESMFVAAVKKAAQKSGHLDSATSNNGASAILPLAGAAAVPSNSPFGCPQCGKVGASTSSPLSSRSPLLLSLHFYFSPSSFVYVHYNNYICLIFLCCLYFFLVSHPFLSFSTSR
jgi:hypothetical protein